MFLEVHGEDTKAFCTGGKDVIDCMTDDKNRIFVMELILHCSDISNPFKPYALCAKWADLVVEVGYFMCYCCWHLYIIFYYASCILLCTYCIWCEIMCMLYYMLYSTIYVCISRYMQYICIYVY